MVDGPVGKRKHAQHQGLCRSQSSHTFFIDWLPPPLQHALGKWDVGFMLKECSPTYRGYDTFFGVKSPSVYTFTHTHALSLTHSHSHSCTCQ
jgi:hypothetical protein